MANNDTPTQEQARTTTQIAVAPIVALPLGAWPGGQGGGGSQPQMLAKPR